MSVNEKIQHLFNNKMLKRCLILFTYNINI